MNEVAQLRERLEMARATRAQLAKVLEKEHQKGGRGRVLKAAIALNDYIDWLEKTIKLKSN